MLGCFTEGDKSFRTKKYKSDNSVFYKQIKVGITALVGNTFFIHDQFPAEYFKELKHFFSVPVTNYSK